MYLWTNTVVKKLSQYLLTLMAVYYSPFNSNQLSTGQSQNRDTIRYATSGDISSLSIDAKKSALVCHDPVEDFEVGAPVNPLPISPKPKLKKSPKEPSITASVNPCYAISGCQGPPKSVSAKKLQPHTQIQGQVQQSKGRPPTPVYESLD